MTLAGRISVFFLATLAVVLTGFSVLIYLLTSSYFARRADERLSSAIETLASAAEIHQMGIEWEPNARHFTLGRDTGHDQVRWTVEDGMGHPVAESENRGEANLGDGGIWRSSRRLIDRPAVNPIRPYRTSGPPRRLYDRLVITAAVSSNPGGAELRLLAWALAGGGSAAWLLAAGAAHFVCRSALAPVREMASAASKMDAADLHHRLAVPKTGDALDELGTAFNGLLDRLETAFERLRRFTGDAAHQLNTPLTVLLGQLEVALRRERSANEYRVAIETAHSQAVHLRRIVESLLFLVQPECDGAPPARTVVELAAWLRDQAEKWQASPRSSDLRLQIEGNRSPLTETVPHLLSQLLELVLDNACKYSAPGTPVTVRLRAASNRTVIEVEDLGMGIAADDLERIFEPFYRSAEARLLGKPGVGLGLALARRIANVLDCELTVKSEPGLGSRFIVQFGVEQDHSASIRV